MCFVFPVKFVNLVVYVTTPESRPPRIDSAPLRQFLNNVANPDQTRTWTEDGRRELSLAAEQSRAVLAEFDTNEPLSPERLREVTAPLKRVLADHILFALPAGAVPVSAGSDKPTSHKLNALLHYMAAASGTNALVLIPDSFQGRYDRTIIDPMPAVDLLAEYVENWPGVLFWSRSGAAAFASIDEALDLYKRLEASFALGAPTIDAILRGYRPAKRSRRLLHLSDLHFGTPAATRNLETLRAQMLREAPDVSRVVITGDLINTPGGVDDPDFADFKDFRRWLAEQTGSDVIVVPGNHDERWLGNRAWFLGDDKNAVADLSWSKIVVDPALTCVFLCFDSAREGFAATGSISPAQLEDMERELESVCARTPEARAFQRIVLLHHHPAQYDPHRDLLVGPLPDGGLLDQERLLALRDADIFLEWCRKFDVRVILHGHKHLQRLRPNHAPHPAIVGCGTSLGAEDKPLSYNVLTFNPIAGDITVAMHENKGRGFLTVATSILQVTRA